MCVHLSGTIQQLAHTLRKFLFWFSILHACMFGTNYGLGAVLRYKIITPKTNSLGRSNKPHLHDGVTGK